MRVKIHRATSKKPRRLWGLDGGAGVLRAKIVIFAYLAGAQRLLAPKARAWRAERRRREDVRRREHCGPGARMFDHPKKKVMFAYSAGAQRLPQARSACRSALHCLPQARSACCERRRRDLRLTAAVIWSLLSSYEFLPPGPKKCKKTFLTSAEFSFLSTPAEPNHKNAPKIR